MLYSVDDKSMSWPFLPSGNESGGVQNVPIGFIANRQSRV